MSTRKTLEAYYEDYLSDVRTYNKKGGGVGWAGPMMQNKPMSFEQFKQAVAAEKSGAKYAGKHYMGTARFAHRAASETVNELSYKQALEARAAAEKAGLKPASINEYRYRGWSPELLNAIKKEREKLEKDNPTMRAKDISRLIAQMYFGSL